MRMGDKMVLGQDRDGNGDRMGTEGMRMEQPWRGQDGLGTEGMEMGLGDKMALGQDRDGDRGDKDGAAAGGPGWAGDRGDGAGTGQG